MNGYTWVKPAAFVLSLCAVVVAVSRWTGHIEGQLDMLSYQVAQANNQLTSAAGKLEVQADQVRTASEQAHVAASTVRDQAKIVKELRVSIDSLTFRVGQIERHLKMYEGGK